MIICLLPTREGRATGDPAQQLSLPAQQQIFAALTMLSILASGAVSRVRWMSNELDKADED